MTVISIPVNTEVKITLNAGVNDNGKKINKYKTLDKARPEADNEVLLNLAEEMAAMQKHSVASVIRHEEYTLLRE